MDLRGNPDSLYLSDPIVRTGQCCGVSNPVRCISFEVRLDSNAAGVVMYSDEGALPPGSYFYQIGCGPQLFLDSVICLSGPGPHYLTFCKPGGNVNVYGIKSVGKPTFPADDSTRIGCYKRLTTYGLDTNTVVWNSIFPGAPGAYNSYLSATSNATSVTFTPEVGSPAFIDYQICGQPSADECGYVLYRCDTVRMYVMPVLEVTVGPQPANYCASSGGLTLAATASGGDSNYTYHWVNPLGNTISDSSTAFANMPGQYIVYVNDGLSGPTCAGVNYSIQVNVTADPVVNAGPDQTVCPVSPEVALAGNVTNAPGGVWTGGAGSYAPNANAYTATYTPTALEIGSGSVALTLTSQSSGACPDISDVMTIFFGDTLVATLTGGPPACNGDSVTLNVAVTTGNGSYGYLWSTGFTGTSIYAGDGAYCVTVTDVLGCEDIACTAVASPPLLTVSATATDATTIGGTDGTATATAAGGVGGYSYLWSNGGNTAMISGLGLGVYTVTVTDGNGCTAVASTVVNDPRCLGFSATAVGGAVDCYGAKDAFIHVTSVTGGMAPYSYLWLTTPTQANDTAFNVGAGAYSVIVTDAQGCNHLVSVTVTEPPRLENFMTHTNNTVISGTSGTATANPVGGNGGYSYAWSNGQITQTSTGLAAGVYNVTITDDQGCSMEDSVRITEPPCTAFNLSFLHNDLSCAGANDGSATVVATGATPPLSYVWSSGATTQVITALSVGSYSVTVTDSILCENFANIAITSPSALAITFIPVNVRCNGGSDGSIDLTVTGGTPPYSFAWSNLSTSEDLLLLRPGNYAVTVTDANGCTISGARAISEPTKLAVTPLVTNVSCAGLSDGSIDLTPSGGVGSYTYLWSNGAMTQDLSALGTGAYAITLTDANLCQLTKAYYVAQPDTVRIDSFAVGCTVALTGDAEITAFISGGNGRPWQLSTDNGGSFGAAGDTIATVAGGATYNLVAQDQDGCQSLAVAATVNAPVAFQSINFALCFPSGTTQTTISVTGIGGAGAPYRLSLDGGSTFGTPGDLDSLVSVGGTYTLTLQDSLSCISIDTMITVPATMTANASSPSYNCGTNVSCNGLSDGSASVATSGGVAPYSHLWSNGQSTATATGLAAGSYTVTVTDANGCTATAGITLTQPAVVTAAASSPSYNCGTNVSCNGASDGSATVTPGGGCAPYTQVWSNGQSTATATGLAAGSYTVTVTDANGCTATASTTLTQPTVVTSSMSLLTYNCGYHTSTAMATDGEATAVANGGCAPYGYLWSDGQTTATATGLGGGTYTVTVTDANGCSGIAAATLVSPSPFVINVSRVTYNCGFEISCNGANDGQVMVQVAGGCPPYAYSWSNGSVNDSIAGLAAGTYTVTVVDDNNDSLVASVTLTEPAALAFVDSVGSYVGGNNVSCNGATDGWIDLSAWGGADCQPYTFLWSGPNGYSSSQDSIAGLGAGAYGLTVTDVNGCSNSYATTLVAPAALLTSLGSLIYNGGWNTSCAGAQDGEVYLAVTGGTTSYGYAWSNGASGDTLTGLGGGNYVVTVTDQNGCSAMDSILLMSPPAMGGTLSSPTFAGGWNIRCNGGASGSIDLEVSGGTPGYTYAWNNGSTTQDQLLLTAGSYVVTVTDANGCSLVDTLLLTEPSPMLSTLEPSQYTGGWNVSCNGATDGSIDLAVNGGTGPYGYLWSNFSTSEDPSNLGAGLYLVGITDANGCLLSDTISLIEPPVLVVNATVTDASCNGQASGGIDLSVAGGTPGYSYTWLDGGSTEDRTGLPAGSYGVTVNDQNGCSLQLSLQVGEASPVDLSAAVTQVSCSGQTDGSIDLTVSGGQAPYTYLWNEGSTTEDLSGLMPGTYDVLVLDASGCMDSAAYLVTEPNPVVANAGSDSTTCATGMQLYAGALDSSQTGLWTVVAGGATLLNPDSPTALLSGLGVGANVLVWTVTQGGCSAGDSLMIYQPTPDVCAPSPLEMPNGFTPNIDGANDYFVVHGIERYPNNLFVVFNRWGNEVYALRNYQNQWDGQNLNGEALPDGTYFVILNINNGEIVLHGFVDMRR